jgi:hypothetical protein
MAPAAAGLVANATRMSQVTLTQDLMARLAGWEAIQEARSLLASGRVVESDWQPPRLLGVVREGNGTHSAGLLIRSETDADNLCPCRASRQRGLICAHSVAVGLHRIRVQNPLPPPVASTPKAPAKPAATTRRVKGLAPWRPLEKLGNNSPCKSSCRRTSLKPSRVVARCFAWRAVGGVAANL